MVLYTHTADGTFIKHQNDRFVLECFIITPGPREDETTTHHSAARIPGSVAWPARGRAGGSGGTCAATSRSVSRRARRGGPRRIHRERCGLGGSETVETAP